MSSEKTFPARDHNDLDGLQGGTSDQEYHLTSNEYTAYRARPVAQFVMDGGGAAISTGCKFGLRIPNNLKITGWHIYADVASSLVADVWKKANAIPTVADTIAGTEKPTLTAQTINSDTNLTSMNTNWSAGDIVFINVDSNDLAKWCKIDFIGYNV